MNDAVAVSYHMVARTQSCMGDFRSALQNEKETYTIYKLQVCHHVVNHMTLSLNQTISSSSVKNTRKQKSLPNVFGI